MRKTRKGASGVLAAVGGALLTAILALSLAACSHDADLGGDTLADARSTSDISARGNRTLADARSYGCGKDETGESGYDEESQVYNIYDLDGLKDWVAYMEKEDDYSISATLHSCITWDSSADGTWTPVRSNETYPYTGTFDGARHTVAGIEISESGNNAGFFGVIGDGAIVKDLTLKAPVVESTGAYSVGAVAGRVQRGGKIENCVVSGGTVTATGTASGKTREQIGGIAGFCGGEIVNCTNSATVIGGYSAGGIAGWSGSGSISKCTNRGRVTGSNRIGGILGSNYGNADVAHCANYGNVSGDADGGSYIGGIAGYNYSGSTISRCNNYGAYVRGTNYVGGIAGHYCNNGGELKGCKNTAKVMLANEIGNSGDIVGGTDCQDCQA